MLVNILEHIKALSLEDLRALNRSVAKAIKGEHQRQRESIATKFEEGMTALHCGRRVRIERVMERHLVLDSGQMVPMTQCRPFSAK